MKYLAAAFSALLVCGFCLTKQAEAQAPSMQSYGEAQITFSMMPSQITEPTWTSRVLKSPQQREHLASIPIHLRPYRPLHFYGNTIRRSYYRGNPLPMPRDILQTTRLLIRR